MDEEWDLSVEELASIEENAKKEVAERRGSSSTASSAASPMRSPQKGRVLPGSLYSSPSKGGPARSLPLKLFKDRQGYIGVETQYHPDLVSALKTVPGHEWDQSRRIWTYPENKLELLLSAIHSLSTVPISVNIIPPLHAPGSFPSQNGVLEPQHGWTNASTRMSPKSTKRANTVTVQLYLMDSQTIAARNPYHEEIKEACQSVSGRSWNVEERVWTFPKSNIDELVQALKRVRNPAVLIEATPPLKLPESSNICDDDSFRGTAIPRVALWSPSKKQSGPKTLSSQSQELNQSQTFPTKISVKLSLHESGNIAAKFEYEQRLVAAFKSIPGAEWRPRERVWLFPLSSLDEAEKILSNVDNMIVNIEHLEPLVRRALEVSLAMPDLRESYDRIPIEVEKRLLPFQRDGVKFALQHGGRALIADEMGLGKTLQAIAFTTCVSDDWPVLVIAPSSLRLHWATMINQWLKIHPAEISVVMSQCSGSNKEGFNIVQSTGSKVVRLDGLFNIVSYELVSKLQNEIAEVDFQVIIADEAHYMKNAQAKRTLACVPLLQRSKYSLLLTGTPALSRPIELYKQLEALQPKVYRSVHEYGKRYCMGGHFGVYQGASNREELHGLMKTTIMIRRLKKEVLSELPLKRRQQIFLSLDEKGVRQMRALFNELEVVKREIKCSKSQEEADKLRYTERQLISKIYTESAEVKLPAVQDYLSTVIEADCKFLVFAHHKSLMDGIEQFLVKKKVQYIRIDGSTEASLRQGLVNKFQQTENVKAALLGIRAAGIGLSFTAASTVIFAEMSWTPGELVQAEDRAHRIGQVSSVNVYYLHAHDTVDDLIWESVQHKLENVGQVLDGREDALHVASSEKYHGLPAGQSTLKGFLRPCDNKSPSNGESRTSKRRKLIADEEDDDI
ncbi:hypothetical protein KP509_09G005400 [Ceratopteris richardii]|uniref:SWI/SNF-related matrix-associated actin-dependent regulator of chromatin subfamily A-like protein 1 n=1 Tax=Ceratopteris richardii TaxID=49495 RepID=A0A8T2U4F9_CERRI|nr:hypothetical protein KP509_09G005400 [Ceratopteris richardii]